MNIQEQIAALKRENEEAIEEYAKELRQNTVNYCVKNGGHFLTPWRTVVHHPVFNVASLEERTCNACGYTENRVPLYEELNAVGVTDTFGSTQFDTLIESHLGDEDD